MDFFEISDFNLSEERNKKSQIILERFVKIFELREKGYTHQKIANEVGLDRTYISKILKN